MATRCRVLDESPRFEAFDAARSALAERVIGAMRGGIASDEAFTELALAVFQHQLQWNAPYASFVDAQLGAHAGELVADWRQIPAVSTDVFKITSLPIVCGSVDGAKHRFRTSGTTGETRGTHYFHSLDVYEASIEACWRQLGLPQLPPSFLAVAPCDSPESSLGHMMRVLQGILPNGGGYFVANDGVLQREALLAEIIRLPPDQPVLLLGTALAFLHLFEEMESAGDEFPALPPGSAALETGGYKGSGRTLEKPAFYRMFERCLGLPSGRVINEYSMTELSSQFYAEGDGAPHRGPSWARVRIVDPETQDEVDIGEVGYVQIFDLANIDSVLAIQTRDLAVNHGGGRFELIGRDPSALPRGCSRAVDELMTSAHGETP